MTDARWEEDDRFDTEGLTVNAAGLPVLVAVAWVLNLGSMWTIFGFLFQATYHELGHATTAWLSGRFAMPLPIGLTMTGADRSPAVGLGVGAAFVAGAVLAARARRFGVAVVAAGVAGLAVFLSAATTNAESTLWMVFGGCAGEIVLSALVASAFYLRMPERARWDFWRWAFALVAWCCLVHSTEMWLRVASDVAKLPRGTAIGGSSDTSGDMDRLVRAGWTPLGIARTYLGLAQVAWLALGALYVGNVVRAWLRGRAR
jgi:hypothetical protein